MPTKKKVGTLLDLSLTGVIGFIETCTESVTQKSYWISTHPPVSGNLDYAEKRAGDYIDKAVDWLRTYLFTSVPWYHYQGLVDLFITWLTKAVHLSKAIFRRSNSPPESVHHAHVLVRFIHLVIHPRVKSLDLSTMPKVLRDALYRQLDHMSGLEVLNLGSGNGESSRQNSFLSLARLINLTSLSLVSDCQNETLAIIGQNCSKLKFLDICSSGGITEQGTTWLLLCQNLEYLNLFQTSQSVAGYAQLLQGLPKLKNIGRCDAFGQVMEYLARYRSVPAVLPITHLHSRDMSYQQLQLAVKFCPYTEHVNLYVDEDLGHLLTPLARLQHLKELKLLACNFYSDRVDRLVRDQGHNLTLLHLEHVDELDMSALRLIAECCPNLQKLVFFSCDFVENFGPPLTNQVFLEPPFCKLHSLVCVSESAPNVIEFLLTHAENLKSVQFGSTAWFNDQIVTNVLSRNALKKIEEIRILRSYELTMGAVQALLLACPRLKVLAEMDGWEGITEQELLRLRDDIKRNNWELDTFITWSVTG